MENKKIKQFMKYVGIGMLGFLIYSVFILMSGKSDFTYGLILGVVVIGAGAIRVFILKKE